MDAFGQSRRCETGRRWRARQRVPWAGAGTKENAAQFSLGGIGAETECFSSEHVAVHYAAVLPFTALTVASVAAATLASAISTACLVALLTLS